MSIFTKSIDFIQSILLCHIIFNSTSGAPDTWQLKGRLRGAIKMQDADCDALNCYLDTISADCS